MATTQPVAKASEVCVHSEPNYGGAGYCASSAMNLPNMRIRSWSNTTGGRWCLDSNNGFWYAHPGHEPDIDYGNAQFRNMRPC